MSVYPSIHPFPARMAPELAVNVLNDLSKDSVVLDPMSGSGTVVRHASELGLRSRAFDLDPLAVLISRTSCRIIDDMALKNAGRRLISEARSMKSDPELPWIDGDADGERFTTFWFDNPQRSDLRRISHLLFEAGKLDIAEDVADALRLALSRIIVTKAQTASLAQDTSHSRPHRVATTSEYDVLTGFERSIQQLRRRLSKLSPIVEGVVERGDARTLGTVSDETIDYVLTSPPYLNAIDYMRGHRLSLIWLGHRYAELSRTRSNSIGAERALDFEVPEGELMAARAAMGAVSDLPSRHQRMIDRYNADLKHMIFQVHRVLRPGSKATFVMGDSCLKGIFLSNSNALAHAAKEVGFRELDRRSRTLPAQHRYLPTPKGGALSKRMRTENIITFEKSS